MAQILTPTSDLATGSWSNTPLWSKVDDDSTVNASGDGTTITSDNNTAPDNADLGLATGTDPSSSSSHILRARWNKDSSGGHAINAVLELWQGTPGTGTSIATLSVTGIGNTETESTYTLSASEADSITDYSALNLRVSRQGETGGNPNGRRSLVVDLVELEIPDATAAPKEATGSSSLSVSSSGQAAKTAKATGTSSMSISASGTAEIGGSGTGQVTVVGTSQAGSAANGGDVTLTFDGTPQEDDCVILIGGNADQDGSGAVGPSTAGYTERELQQANDGSNLAGGVWTKFLGATPDTDVIGQGSGVAQEATSYACIVLRGVDPAVLDAAIVKVGPGTQGASDPDPGAVDTTTDNALVIACGVMGSSNAASAAPSGYSNLASDGAVDTNRHGVALATKEVPTAGTEDPGTLTWQNDASGFSWMFTVAIQPASTGSASATGSSSLSLTSSGQGTRVAKATGTSSVVVSTSGAAKATRKATGSSSLATSTSGSAKRTAKATGSSSLALTSSGSGSLAGQTKTATGTSSLSLSSSATPQRTAKGSGSSSVVLTSTATPQRIAVASGSSALAFTAVGTPHRTAKGVGSSALVFSASGETHRTAKATGSTELVLTSSGRGDNASVESTFDDLRTVQVAMLGSW